MKIKSCRWAIQFNIPNIPVFDYYINDKVRDRKEEGDREEE